MKTPIAAYTGNQPYVFVCYAHVDSDVVYPEIAWLHDEGINVWYDEGISAGKNWRTVIGDSLLRATHVLFYVSNGSLESDHCNREINLALDEGKHVIPVYIENVELTTDLKVGLNRVQALHRDQDSSYRAHLLSSLGASLPIETQFKVERSRNHFPTRVGVGLIVALSIVAGWWYFPLSVPVTTEAPASDAAESGITTLAIVPFHDLSPDVNDPYRAAGLTLELNTQLEQLSNLRLIDRNTVRSALNNDIDPAEFGQALKTTHVLSGTIRMETGTTRVTAQLSNTTSQQQTWAGTFDMESQGLLTLHSEMAVRIVNALGVELSGEERGRIERIDTDNVAAFKLTQEAKLILARTGDPTQAMPLNDKALVLDPDFGEALVLQSTLFLVMAESGWGNTKENWLAVREAAERARLIVPESPFIYLNLGATYNELDLDFRKTMNAFEHADRLGAPRGTLAGYQQDLLLQAGRYDECVKRTQEAVPFDPLDALLRVYLGRCLGRSGRIDEAIIHFDHALEMAPENRGVIGNVLYEYLWVHRRTDLAKTVLAKLGIRDEQTEAAIDFIEGDATPFNAYIDNRVADRTNNFMRADQIAWAYYELGRYSEHIAWYQVSTEEFANLGMTPEYLRRLPDYWSVLRNWALLEAGLERERLALIDQHRTLIDRITEKMVL